jgi:hypothetical protein
LCRNWILSKIAGTLRMVRGPKYDGKYLQALTNVVIPTFDIALLQPTIFSSFEVSSERAGVVYFFAQHSSIIKHQFSQEGNSASYYIVTRSIYCKQKYSVW